MKTAHILTIAGTLLAFLAVVVALLAVAPDQLLINAKHYWDFVLRGAAWASPIIIVVLVVCLVVQTRRFGALKRQANVTAHTDLPRVVVVQHRNTDLRVREFRKALNEAAEIDAIGIGNNALTSEASIDFYRSFLITRRGRLRIMFLDPDGEQIKQREAAENRQPGTLSYSVKHNLEDLQRFVKTCAEQNPRAKQSVEVRLYNFPPHINCIVVDSKIAFVHYYGTHTPGFEAPSLIVTKEEADIFSFFQKEVESLWKTGQPWAF